MKNTYATTQLHADLVCLACTRKTATRIAEQGRPTVIQLEPGVHPEYARRRVCQACRGPLWFTDPDTRTVLQKLPDSEINPGPGRPRKSPHGPKTVPCADCGILRTKQGKRGGPRCHPCAMALLTAQAEARDRELVAILAAADRPLSSREIADLLGSDRKRTSDRIRFARYRGAPIVTVGKAYRLDVAS